MFVDCATIHVRSGKGGAGCVSFRREKFVPKGGPDGGDGGDGGSVIVVAEAGVDTLRGYAGRHHWHAGNGQPGGPAQRHGRAGSDLMIPVPPGTLVYDEEAGTLLADLDADAKRFEAARGGRGGFGNEHFKGPQNQAPNQATPGESAVERTLRLELKLIADIGLVGKPNAGKSTLLSRLSNAKPKIGAYPFTTLEPNLGIAELSGERRLVLADIPGLIEGAAEGHGLGIEFLRHVERTSVLVHLLDVEPADGSKPTANFRAINRELAAHSRVLAAKPQLVVLTKLDLMPHKADRDAATAGVEEATGQRPHLISAATGEGLGELLEACWQWAKGKGG